jgi:PAS domain S-box-containing protein
MESAQGANEAVNILIAEDSPTQSAQLVRLLERNEYAVRAARNGREGLEMLEREPAALVITDVVMPELDGYGFCKAIKEDARWKQIPVILVTTLVDAEDVIKGLECGADNFIRKPYDERYLLSRIDYLLMNVRIRKSVRLQVGVEINLGGQRYFITSERQQILDLLISTYEQAIQINNDLKVRERELGRANQVLHGLYRIAKGLNQAQNESEVAEVALERAMEIPGVQAGWIFLDVGKSGFRLAAVRNIPPALPKDCVCLQRRRSDEPAANVTECEWLMSAGGTAGFRSHASIPLVLGDRTLGVLNLVGPDDGLFPEHELQLLRNIGYQVAVALDRTRLRGDLEQLVEERTRDLEAEIAERTRTEVRLQESQQRYRLLFDRNPHPTWVYDVETLAFLAVNRAAVMHYGYSEQQFLSMTIRDIRPLEDVPPLLNALRQTPESETPHVAGVFNHLKADGTVIQVEIASSEISFSGRRAGLVQAIDVTDKRRLEQQFLRAQRMESIGTLAGGMAHDLNNLLMPILMGVTFLKRQEPTERTLPTLDNMERSAKRGSDLVKQMLSFARGVEGSRVPVHLADVVREIDSIVESTFPKDVTLDADIQGDLWAISGDPTQINQVFLNLCVNARDAMPNGGRISLVARNIEIDEQYARMHRDLDGGKFVLLEVADEGSGMPPEIVDRVFEPFFTTKGVGRGTGLGLSTVAAIVRSHGGTVNVYSELGKGSVFKMYFPAQSDQEADDTGLQSIPLVLPRGSGELILLVDDEVPILTITTQTLQTFGYRVITAEDGAKAIALYAVRRDEIAVVITDMMMPVMDGRALIAAIHSINPDVRIIASSGLAEGASGRFVDAAVKYFLHKPYSADVLLTTLARVIAGE